MIKFEQAVLWPAIQDDVQVLKTERLSSLLKWAGGKEQELKYISPLMPSFDKYYEPFVGGGAVFFSIHGHKKFINDKCPELFHFYRMVAENNKDFFQALDTLLCGWQRVSDIVDRRAADLIKMYKAYTMHACSSAEMQDSLLIFMLEHSREFREIFAGFFNKNIENFMQEIHRNLFSKTSRMQAIESRRGKLPDADIVANIESALKSAFYMHLRYLYNKIDAYEISPGLAAAIFFFVRENAYASMFRYNSRGEFNVPYGGISYNRKDLARKVAYMRSPAVRWHFQDTGIENMDFETFLFKHTPQANDFIFLDPPYDSEFSTYAQNEFGKQEQARLASYLLNRCQAKFMLVIKNTLAIFNLYDQTGLTIKTFDKKYLVSFQDRNNKDAQHLIITNY
ncbi:MAG: DNA adenine methylase [Ktedonobacteraceae bacterium]